MTKHAELKRVIALLEEAKVLVRNEPNVAEQIEQARHAALEQLYPAAKRLVPLRRERKTA
jgi:hypothetical protein